MDTSQHHQDEQWQELLSAARLPFRQSEDEAWAKVAKRISGATVIPIDGRRKRWAALYYAAAAAVLLVMGLFFTLQWSQVQVSSEQQAGLHHRLPDGSKVVLNRASEIAYNKIGWYFARKVELRTGEAFFEVEEGSRFDVTSPAGLVRVLGTSFNVDLNAEGWVVACKTGHVQVLTAEEANDLYPGESLHLGKQGATKVPIAAEDVGAWVLGKYTFDAVPVRDVLQVIAAEKGYKITITTDKSLSYTGGFNSQQDLEQILTIVCKPLDLKFRIDEAKKKVTVF